MNSSNLFQSQKRTEENYKFVFKKVFKRMRENFKSRIYKKKRCKKLISEKAFYEEYFL